MSVPISGKITIYELSQLSDFVTCSTHFTFWSEGSIALKHCMKIKFSKYVHVTLIYTSMNSVTLE